MRCGCKIRCGTLSICQVPAVDQTVFRPPHSLSLRKSESWGLRLVSSQFQTLCLNFYSGFLQSSGTASQFRFPALHELLSSPLCLTLCTHPPSSFPLPFRLIPSSSFVRTFSVIHGFRGRFLLSRTSSADSFTCLVLFRGLLLDVVGQHEWCKLPSDGSLNLFRHFRVLELLDVVSGV